MSAYEGKVYPYHLAFLRDFPHLADWLNCRGFSLRRSHQDFALKMIYSFWDDRTSEERSKTDGDASENLMIAYFKECKTVEVFRRYVATDRNGEKTLVDRLDTKFKKGHIGQSIEAGNAENDD
jgi:hypothetical protein